ncbi:copper chaperone PCu(A)C [Poseidonocella sedimentorum]|uniref:Copper(I)-binding protein n=1 Tax=Poseidonocella sedimentorum TaxID=871652 RepID=A0A1I6ELK8_9RHOB|nr:copper chaperone PCu(A)C [Poseidonocella sedimentorum]SFR18527.1 hypothetical protein SAMN04515673_11420 [Poseidonocella sedimentorum]
MTRTTLASLAVAALCATPLAADIMVTDAYVRSAMSTAKSAAAFMIIHNTAEAPDRLIAVESDIAARVELHTHISSGDGVMQMREDEDGFDIPADGIHALERGADHVMFMGLSSPMEDGASVPVRLIFEKAGVIDLDLPVRIGNSHDAMDGGDHGAHKNH